MVKNISILGAGTAGMLAALWSNKFLVDSNVTVIENSKKGIIGVGEATFPTIRTFLESVDIDPLHMIRSVKGTIKNGISFENWNGDGKKFMHDFWPDGELYRIQNNSTIYPLFKDGCGGSYYQKQLIEKNKSFNEYFYSSKLSYNNEVDLDNITYAFHFNTNKVSKYLKEIAEERGIKFVDGDFIDVSKDDNEYITEIILDTQNVETDFIFDCSGFSKLILGGVYDENWISYEKYLPMKCAIPFFLENGDDIKPYTSAIAMKNGWMWQTPLQDRIGAGYVFDSDYITPEEAKEEVEGFLGYKIKVNKVIPFDAGRFENVWVKNCIGLGLSSSFIEPLESTSIVMTTDAIELLPFFINNMDINSPKNNIKRFNEIMSSKYNTVMDFVYLHYLTKRNDSKFWREFREKNPVPETLKEKIEILKENDFKWFNLDDFSIWPIESYITIANGLELIENNKNEEYANLSPTVDELGNIFNNFRKNNAKKHKEIL